MTARPNSMTNWKASDFIAKVQRSKLRLVPAPTILVKPTKWSGAKRTGLPAYRRRYANSIVRLRMNQARWEADRLTVRAACEVDLINLFPPAPTLPLPSPPKVPYGPPPWPVRDGWHPWVVDHAMQCAAKLGVDLFSATRRAFQSKSFTRQPSAVLARWSVWTMMRTNPHPQMGIPSFPEIGAAFGCNHSSVVTGVQEYRKRFGTGS